MSRRQAREVALQTLYQIDISGTDPLLALDLLLEILQRELPADDLSFARHSGSAVFSEKFSLAEEDRAFALDLVTGTVRHLDEIDALLGQYSKDWALSRLARVDHNIMRLAVYEMLHRPDVPGGVAINEAVELAKVYGNDDSARFVNGVLGKIWQEKVQGP
ncbi:transcription antitermination factor NusB [Desulfurispora thermophila]|uniref:transcription antitermination factor NusB n=1 Tax=Desulfurispora thermophila TaxID=265470 RepID=UPI0003772146|nr:transcription antitermination factor NusB [Desulfurispora thermophila]